MCLHYFSIIVTEDKGYFMSLGIAEFKAFNYLFCWTPPTLIEVVHTVAFLCMYLTWSFLLPSGERYIPNMNIAPFALRY